jgi:glycine/serine hydroxymethyltransferase
MRGMVEEDMREIGAIILETLDPAADLAALRERTRELLAAHPLYPAFGHGFTAS